jgi:hypothetical protein
MLGKRECCEVYIKIKGGTENCPGQSNDRFLERGTGSAILWGSWGLSYSTITVYANVEMDQQNKKYTRRQVSSIGD